jgi:type I restriction enzyme S subunit
MMFYKETNFKETAIGKIPKDWEVTKLEDIAHIYSGNTAPQDKKYFEQGNYPFIRVQHLQDLEEGKYPQIFDLINDLAISELKLRKFKKGSIIFPKSGESIRLEKRAILREDSYLVNHLAVIEPIDTNIIDNLFLFYYLLTIKTSNYLTKTTMPSLNLSIIQKFLILLPPLIEQQKIAEILSTVDEAIQKTNEIIAKTERLKKGLMQELLTKGIGHKEFKDTEIGRIPKDWEVIKLSDVINTLPGFAFSSEFFSKEKGIPLIRIRDLEKDSTEAFYNGPYEKEYLVEKGDILVSMDGEFNVCLWKGPSGLLNQRVMKIWPKCKEKLDTLYLYYASQKPLKSFEYRIAATTVKHLLTEHLRLIKIPLPTETKEQQKIALILSTVDRKLEIERGEKARLEKIKQGLMDLLLTGKVRVKVN